MLAYSEFLCFLRYPTDVYDRVWTPFNYNSSTILSTSLLIDSQSNNYYQPPSIVMSTASTPINVSAPLELNWNSQNATSSQYYVYMHFAQVVNLKANQSRSFNVTVNGKFFYGPIVPQYLYTFTVYSTSILAIAQNYDLLISKTKSSTLPPILNALEIYSIRDLSKPGTNQQDGMFSSTHACHLVPYSILYFF